MAPAVVTILPSSRNTHDFSREIRAQSETCLHREYNLAAAIRRMIFLQATDNLLHTIMKEAGTVFSVPALQISVPGGIRTHDLPLRRRTLYPAELQKQS